VRNLHNLFHFDLIIFIQFRKPRELAKSEEVRGGGGMSGAWVLGVLETLTSSGASKRNSGIRKKHLLDGKEQRGISKKK